MRKLLLVCGLFVSLNSFAQRTPDSTTSGRNAAKEIENIFYCGVGEAPMILSKEDRRFEKQFKVDYFITGCLLPLPMDALRSHNRIVAGMLDKKYGIAWRKKLRADVEGVSE